jgi:glycosyltransferase involved in cell wall biosynthesis
MKLLILTQKIDKNDDVLGFMHGWVLEFAKNCEQLTVVCLGKGEYDFPEKVKVLSLGKERLGNRNRELGTRKWFYCWRFYKYIWWERNNYDAVFVHMNSEYVVLGGLFWRLWHKKIMLWNNHVIGNLHTRLAVLLAHRSFYTSPFSFNAKISGKKGMKMPAGIDTALFCRLPSMVKKQNSLLFLGRISPVKRLEVLLEAVKLLNEENFSFTLDVVGEALPRDTIYFENLKNKFFGLLNDGKVKFLGKSANHETPQIYNSHQICVNLTNSGSLDKTILEAMATETLVLVSNESFKNVLPEEFMFHENDINDLSQKIKVILNRSQKDKEALCRRLRVVVEKEHSLKKLISLVLAEVNL